MLRSSSLRQLVAPRVVRHLPANTFASSSQKDRGLTVYELAAMRDLPTSTSLNSPLVAAKKKTLAASSAGLTVSELAAMRDLPTQTNLNALISAKYLTATAPVSEVEMSDHSW